MKTAQTRKNGGT